MFLDFVSITLRPFLVVAVVGEIDVELVFSHRGCVYNTKTMCLYYIISLSLLYIY